MKIKFLKDVTSILVSSPEGKRKFSCSYSFNKGTELEILCVVNVGGDQSRLVFSNGTQTDPIGKGHFQIIEEKKIENWYVYKRAFHKNKVYFGQLLQSLKEEGRLTFSRYGDNDYVHESYVTFPEGEELKQCISTLDAFFLAKDKDLAKFKNAFNDFKEKNS
jgi:hypothetical protein